jgi:putative ATP-binding cassette transporter
MQAAAAFGTVQGSLAWVTSNFSRLSEWYAAASRVAELSSYIQSASTPGEERARIEIREIEGGALELQNVAVKLHNGRMLIADAAFTIAPGEMVMVTGKSGTGKSTLIRAIAGLWPWGSGTILMPKGSRVEFVPQRPYMPLGTLKAALTYPDPVSAHSDEECSHALRMCDMDHLLARLHDHAAWDRILSGGELQRVSFARLLIHKPDIVILDEATSALDEENQTRIMELFRTDLASASVISVAHRTTLARYHNRQITLHKQHQGARATDRLRQLTAWAKARREARRERKKVK